MSAQEKARKWVDEATAGFDNLDFRKLSDTFAEKAYLAGYNQAAEDSAEIANVNAAAWYRSGPEQAGIACANVEFFILRLLEVAE